MPMGDISVMGFNNNDTDEKSHGYDAGSIKAITNPEYIRKLQTSLVKKLDIKTSNKFDFNLGFCKSKFGSKNNEQGEANLEQLKERFPDVDLSNFIKNINSNNISVLIANNVANDQFPLSPWIIVHRIAHVLHRKRECRGEYDNLVVALNRFLSKLPIEDENGNPFYKEIVYDYSGLTPKQMEFQKRMDSWSKRTPGLLDMNKNGFDNILSKLGTFRAAREQKIDRPFEFIFDCITQSVITGKVTFNRNLNLGNISVDIISELEETFESVIYSILEKAVGSVFTM